MTKSYPDNGKILGIHLRKLCRQDLADMHRWLNSDFVSRWYGKKTYTHSEIIEKYGPHIEGATPVDPFLILNNKTPIGYIQVYKISAYPDYNFYLAADKRTVGIDMFIGERHYLYKGFGSAALRLFVAQIVFQREGIDQCIIGPEPTNKTAIRAYHKAGFQYFKTVQFPDQNHSECLMRIDRAMMVLSG